jgi:hypothetical protein
MMVRMDHDHDHIIMDTINTCPPLADSFVGVSTRCLFGRRRFMNPADCSLSDSTDAGGNYACMHAGGHADGHVQCMADPETAFRVCF